MSGAVVQRMARAKKNGEILASFGHPDDFWIHIKTTRLNPNDAASENLSRTVEYRKELRSLYG